MLDEIINYVQSLQRQVEVITKHSKDLPHFCINVYSLLNCVGFDAVSFNEIDHCQSKDGFEHGDPFAKGCK